MTLAWRRVSPSLRVSECGLYELRSGYTDNGFAWRGRVVQTDELVASSADRTFVMLRCEAHAERVAAENNV